MSSNLTAKQPLISSNLSGMRKMNQSIINWLVGGVFNLPITEFVVKVRAGLGEFGQRSIFLLFYVYSGIVLEREIPPIYSISLISSHI